MLSKERRTAERKQQEEEVKSETDAELETVQWMKQQLQFEIVDF
jgi:hypothetical protein